MSGPEVVAVFEAVDVEAHDAAADGVLREVDDRSLGRVAKPTSNCNHRVYTCTSLLSVQPLVYVTSYSDAVRYRFRGS